MIDQFCEAMQQRLYLHWKLRHLTARHYDIYRDFAGDQLADCEHAIRAALPELQTLRIGYNPHLPTTQDPRYWDSNNVWRYRLKRR